MKLDNSSKPFISICIPAYRRLDFLKRLLVSIGEQNYINFEVIITDDSADDSSIEDFISITRFDYQLQYHKNKIALGSPKNWIESFSLAKGDWIKIMHDDDYFTSHDSLNVLASSVQENVDCIFSGYNAVYKEGLNKNMTISQLKFSKFIKNPFIIFNKNIIGPPSVLMYRKSVLEKYDVRLKWIVDWEYYIRLAFNYKLVYINEPLICVSYNDTQITNYVKGNPSIEIPEFMIFYEKYDIRILDSILVYDSWWRLIRNLKIKSVKDYEAYYSGVIPSFIIDIVTLQSNFSYDLLKIGLLSKSLMVFSYLKFRFKN